MIHEREGKLQLWSSKLPENLVGLMLLLESGIKFLVPYLELVKQKQSYGNQSDCGIVGRRWTGQCL